MSITYDLGPHAHSFVIGTRDTYEDFHLVAKDRQVINEPPVSLNYVTVAGATGSLDLTDVLTGGPIYGNRTGTLEFVVLNDIEDYDITKSKISNYLHGRKFKVINRDERMYYYYGRLVVNEWGSDFNHSTISLNYTFDPFKYVMWANDERWLWDPFDFELGVINDWTGVSINGTNTLTFNWGPMEIIPTITVTSTDGKGMKVQLSRTFINREGEQKTETGPAITFPDGVTRSPQLILKEGECVLTITGNGTIKIGAREASL